MNGYNDNNMNNNYNNGYNNGYNNMNNNVNNNGYYDPNAYNNMNNGYYNGTPNYNNNYNNKKSNNGLVIVIIVILVIGLGVGSFFLVKELRNDSSDTNTKETSKKTDKDKDKESTKDKEETKKEEEINNQNDSSVMSNNWKDYQFTANNKVFTLPLSYKDFAAGTGLSMKKEDLTQELKDNYYTYVNLYKDDHLAGFIDVYNDSGNTLTLENCTVSRVSQTKFSINTYNIDPIIFPGNLKVGMKITDDEIIKLLGEPTNKKESTYDGTQFVTYKYNADTTWSTINYYEIDLINGEIDQLTLDNRK